MLFAMPPWAAQISYEDPTRNTSAMERSNIVRQPAKLLFLVNKTFRLDRS